MKTIARIARVELSTLFYSPVAWLVLVIFTVQTGLDFADRLENFGAALQSGQAIPHLTGRIFTGYGLWNEVQRNIYLYIPLLTMGLMSREISSGSIKLLLSSPVTIRSIVLGKYLAMMIYGLILVLILLLFVFTGAYSIHAMDFGLVYSGLIGLYLLICAYSAIGLFMSSLTSYQVVAAISTLVVLAALNFMGEVGQNLPFTRDLTYFLSIAGRSGKFISGLISSKDIFYFIIVILLFLGLTMMKLQAGRESMHGWLKTARYLSFLSIMLLAGYISSRPVLAIYYDMTADKSRTLTKNSQIVLQQLKKPLKVTTYVNLFDDLASNFFPSGLNGDLDRMEEYTRFVPGLETSYVYYYDSTNSTTFGLNPDLSFTDKAKRIAESRGQRFASYLSPAAIKKQIDLKPEENKVVRLWEYDGKKGFTRFFNDNRVYPSEREITATLKGLITTPPVIGILAGNNERSSDRTGDRDYKTLTNELTFRYSLINQGFKVMTVSIGDSSLPDSIACLVIADPKTPFTTMEMAKIKRYIAGGGNLAIAGEPGRQDVLNPLLSELGVQLGEGTLIRESKDFAADFILGDLSGVAGAYSKELRRLSEDSTKISMPGAAWLKYESGSPYTIDPILLSDEKNTWIAHNRVNLDSAKVGYHPELGDEKKRVPLALALTRQVAGKEQKIMVFGDADFMSNSELTRYNVKTGNFALAIEVFKWFSNGEFPIDTSLPRTFDDKMNIGRSGIFMVRLILLFVVPFLIAATGGILLIRRRRK